MKKSLLLILFIGTQLFAADTKLIFENIHSLTSNDYKVRGKATRFLKENIDTVEKYNFGAETLVNFKNQEKHDPEQTMRLKDSLINSSYCKEVRSKKLNIFGLKFMDENPSTRNISDLLGNTKLDVNSFFISYFYETNLIVPDFEDEQGLMLPSLHLSRITFADSVYNNISLKYFKDLLVYNPKYLMDEKITFHFVTEKKEPPRGLSRHNKTPDDSIFKVSLYMDQVVDGLNNTDKRCYPN